MLGSFFIVDPWRSLLVNISAGLLGSVITVLYIEKIMRRNERYEWTKVLGHVGMQVNILANGTTSSLRQALGLDLPISWQDLRVFGDPRRMRAEMLAFIKNQLVPQVSRLANLDRSEWRTLAGNMRNTIIDAERLLTLFARNLEPTIMELILDIHEKARAILSQYQMWPDLLGVPLDELKPNNRGESMVPYFRANYEIIVRDAEQLLNSCANLLQEIDKRFPDKMPMLISSTPAET